MNSKEIVVSICCITYNHASYIRQCLDGFLMQKTTFPIEILIHDDASTDGTQNIIQEYEANYPEIIKPIYQKENQYSKGVKVNLTYNFPRAQGKYIALCEGDDYWTDPLKLQKQVEFLDSHPGYVMCSHRFNQYIQDEQKLEVESEFDFQGVDYTLKTLICGTWYTQTLTVVFLRNALNIERCSFYETFQDVILFYVLLKSGKGYCLSDIMGCYRVHKKGVWSGISLNNQRLLEFNQRIAIYDIEQSNDAALFLICLFARAINRVWLLKQWKILLKSIGILGRHYHKSYIFKLMWRRFLLGKGIALEELVQITPKR